MKRRAAQDRPAAPAVPADALAEAAAPAVPADALAETVAPAVPADALAETVAPLTRRLPRERARKPRRMARLLPVGAVLAAALAVASLGGGDTPRRSARADRVASVAAGEGRVRVGVPAGWRLKGRDSDVPLPLSDPVRLAGPGGSSVTAGLMAGDAAANVSLLPPAFLQSLGLPAGRVPPRDRIALRAQRRQAWRYRDLRPSGFDRRLTLYVVPAAAGVAAVACVPPRGSASACPAVARTLRVRGAYPLGPSAAYADALNAALVPLQRRAQEHAGELAAAATPDALAAATQALADDYGRPARRLENLSLSPADRAANRRLVAALDETARAYQDAAASADDATAFAAARARVDEGRTAIDGALAALGAAGYAAGSGGAEPSAEASPAPQSDSGVGDSRSDDPSDDEPDEGGGDEP